MLIKPFLLLLIFMVHACMCRSQQVVPVRDEPMHHNVFQNEYIRVLDVRIRPGDTSQFHKHETPSVFIVLHPVKTGSEVRIEEQKATALSAPIRLLLSKASINRHVYTVCGTKTPRFFM